MKTWKKIVRLLILVALIIPAAALVAIQIPAVQTAIVGKATGILNQDIDGEIKVGKVYFSFPNNLILKDVDIIQGADDTLAHLGKALVKIKTSSLFSSKEAVVRRVSLEDGSFNIHKLNDSTTNLSALLAPLQKKDKKEPGSLPWDNIRLDRLNLKRIDFSTDSLHLNNINLAARNIRYSEPLTASARIDNLSLETDTGLKVNTMSADMALDSEGIHVDGLRYDDGWSQLDAKQVSLGFKDFSDFGNFLEKVQIDANLRPSKIDMRTAGAFLPLGGRDLSLWVEGAVKGTVSNLSSDKLRIQSDSKQTVADLKFRLRGLPDIERTRIDAEILNLNTTTADLAEIMAGIDPGFQKTALTRYAPGEPIHLTAKANGYLSGLSATGHLSTATMGEASIEGFVRKTGSHLGVEGTASTSSLQLGRLLGNPSLGSLTCQTDIDFSLNGKKMSVDVKPLQIQKFTFNGYDYHDLVASGTLQDGFLQADVVSYDPNLQMTLHSDINLGGKGQDNHYKIDLDLDRIDLSTLHFDKRDSTSLSMALNADIVQTPDGAFLGQADIRGLQATLPGRVFDVGDIALSSTLEDERYELILNSTLAKADYDGNIFITDFLKQSYQAILNDHLEQILGKKDNLIKNDPHPEDFGSFRLRTLDLQPVLDFFAPDLFVSRESSIGVSLSNDEAVGSIASELVGVGNLFFRNLQGRMFTEGPLIKADIDLDRLQVSGIVVDHVRLDAVADSTAIDVVAGFHNEDEQANRAEVGARVSFPDPEDPETDGYQLRVDLRSSDLMLAGHPWEIQPSSILYKEKNIRIEDFALNSGEQSLLADGTVSESVTDTVRVLLNDFDMGIANSFLTLPLNLQGLLTGNGEAYALLSPDRGLLLDLSANQASIADVELGTIYLSSFWDDDDDCLRFNIDNILRNGHPLVATASYHPADKLLHADAQVDSLQVGVLKPILYTLFSEMEGTASGHVVASGPLNDLSLRSEGTRFNNILLKLDYTQVDYRADGPFSISEKGLVFDNILLSDRFGHHATLTGGVPWDHFNNLQTNIRIDLQNIMALNTTSKHNETFYGRAFANGTLRVSGPLERIRLNMNLTPTGNTTIHIPLGNSAKQAQSLLTFINNENDHRQRIDMYDSLMLAKRNLKNKKQQTKSDLSVNLRLNATPDAEIQLEIDKETGDILKARGNGQIAISAGTDLFDIKGDYRVDSGSYHFGMLGFTSRDFTIDPGGTIAFGGDVMQSDLDMTATYRTKASISPLIADSTAVTSRRTVDCRINLTGKLANPEIKFNISIPDLDPTTQGRVESALNTEDKRMKQALALLISGGFVPDEQSGIVNSTTMLYSNASEMMASQLNNIFRQLDIPLDLGFNYQPTETGRDIFDVAVSTQLFNNRVIINGNIGNRHYISSSNSDIVGDLDIEIKLNRQGQLRLTLFSHSADQYSNYLDQSQRNGAGIVYQEDFNSLGELWRKIFRIKTDERQTLPDPNAPGRPLPGERPGETRP